MDSSASSSSDELNEKDPRTPVNRNVTVVAGLGKRPPSHEWTYEERMILCISRLWFASSRNTDTETFHAIKSLLALYFSRTAGGKSLQQVSTGAIIAQCYEITHIKKNIWNEVAAQSRDQLKNHISRLQQIITDNGIDLMKREAQYVPSPRPPISNRRRRREQDSSEDDDYELYKPRRGPRRSYIKSSISARRVPEPLQEDSPQSPLSSPLAQKSRRLDLGDIKQSLLSSIPVSPPHNSVPPSQPDDIHASTRVTQNPYKIVVRPSHGGVSYRFWDDDSQVKLTSSGFLAPGAYCERGGPSPLPPPEPFSAQFRMAARSHLRMEHTPDGSPFISIVRKSSLLSTYDINRWLQWESLLPAIHRALRSNANAFIAIIDARRLSLCQAHEFPEIFPADMVLKDLKEQGDLPRGYYHGLSLKLRLW